MFTFINVIYFITLSFRSCSYFFIIININNIKNDNNNNSMNTILNE